MYAHRLRFKTVQLCDNFHCMTRLHLISRFEGYLRFFLFLISDKNVKTKSLNMLRKTKSDRMVDIVKLFEVSAHIHHILERRVSYLFSDVCFTCDFLRLLTFRKR